MSYLLYNGTDITPYFYNKTSATNGSGATTATGFLINGTDISNTYVGLGTNSNIPVSVKLSTSGFLKNGTDIATLYELNLFTIDAGTINSDYIIWTPSNHTGFLIQILSSSAKITFKYNITNCNFAMIGGGGGGGGFGGNGNAGGGGGAGELITGNMTVTSGSQVTFIIGVGGTGGAADSGTVTYGSGNGPNTSRIGNSGTSTSITCSSNTVTANGGGGGGGGKNSSAATTGSSSGGTGSWSNSKPTVGARTTQTLTANTVFSNLISYGNIGGFGQTYNGDDGGGGGGGGSGGAGKSGFDSNNWSGTQIISGGVGRRISYGSTNFDIGGGGGGGTRYGLGSGAGGASDGGGYGGNSNTTNYGGNGTANTGGGGGGAYNAPSINSNGYGGNGGSGTVFIYIVSSQIS